MDECFFPAPTSGAVTADMLQYTAVNDYDTKYTEKKDGFVFIDALDDIFEIGGITHPNANCGEYYRLDAANKQLYSAANKGLAYNTAGAQVRVCTDARAVIVQVTLRGNGNGMHHFTDRGVYGVDFYVGTGTDRRYIGGQMVTFAISTSYNEGKLDLGDGYKEFTINLPLYEGVKKVAVGFPEGSLIAKPTKRSRDAVCFYGSSITQGGCAGRPGNMYSHIICRCLDCDCMNLGFSGSARGEIAVAKYIGSRKISALVMDFDYNTASAEELAYVHYPFYAEVRKAHPNIPIVFVSHPYYYPATDSDRRRVEVVKSTYERALAEGDKNVRFVDSESFFPPEMRDLYAVDNLHPNDLGHFFMAKAIFPALSKAL